MQCHASLHFVYDPICIGTIMILELWTLIQTIVYTNRNISTRVGTIVDRENSTETSWSSAQSYKPQLTQLKLLYVTTIS